MPESQPAVGAPVEQPVRQLLDDWAEAAGHGWHDTRYGPATDCTVLRNDLEQLVHAAKAQESERWRALLEARAAGCERAAENTEDPKFDAMARVLMSVREDGSKA